MNEILDDGLIIPEVGAWSEEKYKHIMYYTGLFTKSMKNRWSKLVYIDLFSGAGLVKLRNSYKIIEAIPLRVLSLQDKYDLYIFSDIDSEKISALDKRIKTRAHDNAVALVCDANKSIAPLREILPKPSKQCTVLHFCLLDIYALSNFHFTTIKALESLCIDFFVLIPSFMDANRNFAQYIMPADNTVAKYLGNDKWRDDWMQQRGNKKFGNFIVDQFNKQMTTLGYKHGEPTFIQSDIQNLPLYHLVLYSKNDLALKLWKQVKKYANPQTTFDFS